MSVYMQCYLNPNAQIHERSWLLLHSIWNNIFTEDLSDTSNLNKTYLAEASKIDYQIKFCLWPNKNRNDQ